MNTRRDVLFAAPAFAAAAALPASGAALEPDPAVEAVNEWLAAYRALNAARSQHNFDSPQCEAADEAEWTAREKASTTIATTPAGIAAQLLLMVVFVGQVDPWEDISDPEIAEIGEWNWKDDLDRKALISLLEGARALARDGVRRAVA